MLAICMLRGVNVGGHNKIKMDALRDLCESLGYSGARTFIQSGNVLFHTEAKEADRIASRLSEAIGERFGFRPDVIVRTAAELRSSAARNPFAGRAEIDGARLLVTFLATEPSPAARDKVLSMKTGGEELQFAGRELYVYFPIGMGQSKLSMPALTKALGSQTGRNLNSVLKMIEMAEEMEGGAS